MTDYYFVQPLDVLMLRGNKSFGDAGEHGEALMPPWPSLFAGAFRSALLGQDAAQLARFASGERLDGALGEVLGTAAAPGDFRIRWVSVAQTAPQGAQCFACVPLPADLVAFDEEALPALAAMAPAELPVGSGADDRLPLTAVLRTSRAGKPQGGRWLANGALEAYLAGDLPRTTLRSADLFKRESRLGIALDPGARTAAEGAIYTTEAIAFAAQSGFLVGIDGMRGQLPPSGLLRLGGDGKGAAYRHVDFAPSAPSPEGIARERRFKIVLATHAVFTAGWLPECVARADDGYWLHSNGFSARLACAAVPRHETVSGWDLALWQPKTAQRVAPAGSVYWFDRFEGDPGKLAAWVDDGLWGENPDMQRRAEGFNRAWLAAWPNNN